MASAAAKLIDVPELLELPDPPGGQYELHGGRPFAVTFAKSGRYRLQRHLERLLQGLAGSLGEVGIEFAFRPLPHFELRAAEVAYVSRERFDAVPADDYLAGAPDLVVEVLSPSNRKGPLDERMRLCLANGCVEFWIVDPKRRSVMVHRSGGVARGFGIGDVIPLALTAPGSLAVDAIFAAAD